MKNKDTCTVKRILKGDKMRGIHTWSKSTKNWSIIRGNEKGHVEDIKVIGEST